MTKNLNGHTQTVNYKYDKASAATQAKRAIQVIQREGITQSVGTNRNYQQGLQQIAQYIKDNHLGDLRHMTPETVVQFLNDKAGEYQQKTLDMYRQAAQAYFKATDVKEGFQLPVVKSQIETVLEHRAYTPEQIEMVIQHQTPLNAFSTELAHACGLRAHELYTIRPIAEQPPDERRYEDGSTKTLETKWQGRDEGIPYTVVGKGGLCREIRVPENLAIELESHRRETPEIVKDRHVIYESHYAISAGHKWSDSFYNASVRALGWSSGAHGLRHSYGQERMSELTCTMSYEKALATVSQEMGHFRPSITEVYLR